MSKRHVIGLAVLVLFSAAGKAAPVTFTFDVSLHRSFCFDLELCSVYGGSDPAALTLELELADPFSAQAVGLAALTRGSYSAPFPFLGHVDLIPELAAVYSYDPSSALATLELTHYRMIAGIFIGVPRIADISDGLWRYDGERGRYEGFPSAPGPAIAFVGAPIPLPGMLPLFALAVAGVACRRR